MALNMELTREWLSQATKGIKNSPLATLFILAVLQSIAEILVGIEFACPCDPKYNIMFTSVFFIVPPFIFFLLALGISPFCKPRKSIADRINITIVPTATWLFILFIDGRYYACLRTDWSGTYEVIQSASSQQWCKPANSSQEFLAKTQLLYSESQFIGFWAALGLTAIYLLCVCASKRCSCCKNEQNPEDPRNEENEQMELNQQP